MAALSYRSHPSGWQRGAEHGFRREHVPCLVLSATKCHGQLVTTGSTILTRGSKGAQVYSSYMSLKQCVMRITVLLKMFAMEREEGISHPAFVGTQRTLREENPLPSFYSPSKVESQDIRLVLCTRGQHGV